MANKSKITCKHAKLRPERARLYKQKIKKEVVEKYGGVCVCCGECNIAFLTIDHKNNDGKQERMENKQAKSSSSWYLKLRREPPRKDLQLLCWNCNMAKFQCGICPHESKKETDFSPLEIDGRKNGNFGVCEKINWPSDDDLIDMVQKSNCSHVSRQLGVHHTAVRGRLQRRSLYEKAMNKQTINPSR